MAGPGRRNEQGEEDCRCRGSIDRSSGDAGAGPRSAKDLDGEHEADIGCETEPDGEADKAGDQVVNAKVGRPEAQAKPGATFWAHGALERADVISAYRARQ